jgi:predicted enzyme related to lactoylglutathione lyase
MPVSDIATVGRIAVLRDPTGAIIGWMKPEMPA